MNAPVAPYTLIREQPIAIGVPEAAIDPLQSSNAQPNEPKQTKNWSKPSESNFNCKLSCNQNEPNESKNGLSVCADPHLSESGGPDQIESRLRKLAQNDWHAWRQNSLLFGLSRLAHLCKESQQLMCRQCIRPELHMLSQIRGILSRVRPVDSFQPLAPPSVWSLSQFRE